MKKRYLITTLLSIVCCALALCGSLMLAGCDKYVSYFNNKTSDYTLDSDYVMKDDDTTSFTKAVNIDLNGKSLDLNGHVFNVSTQKEENIVLSNGTIKNGSIFIAASKSSILFENITIDESIKEVTLSGNTTFVNVVGQDIKVEGGFLTVSSKKTMLDGGDAYLYSCISQLDNITVSENALYAAVTIGSNVVVGNIYLNTSSSLNISGIAANVVSIADGSYVLAGREATIGKVYVGGKNTVVEYKDGASIGNSYILSDAKKTAIKYNVEFSTVDAINVPAYKIVELHNLCREVKTYVEYTYDDGKSPKTTKLDIAKAHRYGEAVEIFDSEVIGRVYEYTCLDCSSHIREIEDPEHNIVECDNLLEALLLFIPDFNIDYSLEPGMSLNLGETSIAVNEGYVHIVAKDGIINGAVVFDGKIGDKAQAYKGYLNNYTAYYLEYSVTGEGESASTHIDSVHTIDVYEYVVELLAKQLFNYSGEQLDSFKDRLELYFDYFKTGVDITKTVIANADDFINVATEALLKLYNIVLPEGLIEKLNPLGLLFTVEGNTYTLNLENISTLMESSVRNFVDGLYGNETTSQLIDYLVNDVPNKTVGELADDIITFAKEFNVDSDKIFSTINLLVDYINYIKAEDTSKLTPFDIEKLIEEQSELSLNSKSIADINVVKNIKAFLTLDNLNSYVDKKLYAYYDEFLAENFKNTTYSTIKHNVMKWNTMCDFSFTMNDDMVTFINFDLFDVKKIENSQDANDTVPYDKYQRSAYTKYSLDYSMLDGGYSLELITREDTSKEECVEICKANANEVKAHAVVDTMDGCNYILDYNNEDGVETFTFDYIENKGQQGEKNYRILDYVKNSTKETLLIDVKGEADVKIELVDGIYELEVVVDGMYLVDVKYGEDYYYAYVEYEYKTAGEKVVPIQVFNAIYDKDNIILLHYNCNETTVIDFVDNIEVEENKVTENATFNAKYQGYNPTFTYALLETEDSRNEYFDMKVKAVYQGIDFDVKFGFGEEITDYNSENQSVKDTVYAFVDTNELIYKLHYDIEFRFVDNSLTYCDGNYTDYYSKESDKTKIDENTKYFTKIDAHGNLEYNEDYGYIHNISVKQGYIENKISTFAMTQEIIESQGRVDTDAHLFINPLSFARFSNDINYYELIFNEEYIAEKSDECWKISFLTDEITPELNSNGRYLGKIDICETFVGDEKVINLDVVDVNVYYNNTDCKVYEVKDKTTGQHKRFAPAAMGFTYDWETETVDYEAATIRDGRSNKTTITATLSTSGLNFDYREYNGVDVPNAKSVELFDAWYANKATKTFIDLGEKTYRLNIPFEEDYFFVISERIPCSVHKDDRSYDNIDEECIGGIYWNIEDGTITSALLQFVYINYENYFYEYNSEKTITQYYGRIDFVNNDEEAKFKVDFGVCDSFNMNFKEIYDEKTGYVDYKVVDDNQKFISIVLDCEYNKELDVADIKFVVGGKQAEDGNELGTATLDASTLSYYTSPLTFAEIVVEGNKITVYDKISSLEYTTSSDDETGSKDLFDLVIDNFVRYQNDDLPVNTHYLEVTSLDGGTNVYHLHIEFARDRFYDETISKEDRYYETADLYLEIQDLTVNDNKLFSAYAYFYVNGIIDQVYDFNDQERFDIFKVTYTNTNELFEIIVDNLMNYDGISVMLNGLTNYLPVEDLSFKIDKSENGVYKCSATFNAYIENTYYRYDINFLNIEVGKDYIVLEVPEITLNRMNSYKGFEGVKVKLYGDDDMVYVNVHYGKYENSIIDFFISLEECGKADIQVDFKAYGLDNFGIHFNDNSNRSIETFEEVFGMTEKQFAELEKAPD